jgi:hypothetical protein
LVAAPAARGSNALRLSPQLRPPVEKVPAEKLPEKVKKKTFHNF